MKKNKKKYGQARGEKSKKCEGGVFHRQDWSQFKPLAKINLFCKTNIWFLFKQFRPLWRVCLRVCVLGVEQNIVF